MVDLVKLCCVAVGIEADDPEDEKALRSIVLVYYPDQPPVSDQVVSSSLLSITAWPLAFRFLHDVLPYRAVFLDVP
jgi:hypothetical protein